MRVLQPTNSYRSAQMIELHFAGMQEWRIDYLQQEQVPGAKWTQCYTENFTLDPIINVSSGKDSVEHIAYVIKP